MSSQVGCTVQLTNRGSCGFCPVANKSISIPSKTRCNMRKSCGFDGISYGPSVIVCDSSSPYPIRRLPTKGAYLCLVAHKIAEIRARFEKCARSASHGPTGKRKPRNYQSAPEPPHRQLRYAPIQLGLIYTAGTLMRRSYSLVKHFPADAVC